DPLDFQLFEGPGDESRVPPHRVVVPSWLVGPAETGHVERHRSGELARSGDEIRPLDAGIGVAVDEQDGLMGSLGSGLDERRSHPGDSNLSLPHPAPLDRSTVAYSF